MLREELKKALNSEEENIERYIDMIIFSIKDLYFALYLDDVLSVNKVLDYTKLPISPAYIKGLQFISGNAVILFDIIYIIKNTGYNENELKNNVILVVKHNEDYFGILANTLIDIKTIREEDIKAIEEEKYYDGTFYYNDKVITILNIKNIIQSTL